MSSFATPAGAPPSNTLYGGRSIFSVQGVVVGFASSTSWANSYQYSPLQVLGNLETISHLPMSYQVTLTANQFRLVGTTLRTLNLWPRIGSNGQDHLAALVAIPELTATVEDTLTNTIIARFEGCRVESSSVQVSTGQMMVEDITFAVRRMIDESES